MCRLVLNSKPVQIALEKAIKHESANREQVEKNALLIFDCKSSTQISNKTHLFNSSCFPHRSNKYFSPTHHTFMVWYCCHDYLSMMCYLISLCFAVCLSVCLCLVSFLAMYAEVRVKEVRAAMYLMRKVWRQIYEGIRVNLEGIQMLQNLSNQGVPYVLCPMHKSHIDYLLLSYVCFAYHIFPPHVISGENLNIPLVGPVLSWGGGVFIRREFGQDDLYKAIFNEYVAQLLLLGHNLECFIEGARSRTGKLKNPKTGFLSVLVDIIASGRLEKDIALIPIAISYDKVIEGATFVNEMLGAKKQKESLTGLINSLNHVIRLNFGSIDISICQPISLRSSLPSPSSSFIGMAANDKRRIIKAIAYNVMYSMNLRLVISPTAMVATVLLTQLNRGIPMDKLE